MPNAISIHEIIGTPVGNDLDRLFEVEMAPTEGLTRADYEASSPPAGAFCRALAPLFDESVSIEMLPRG